MPPSTSHGDPLVELAVVEDEEVEVELEVVVEDDDVPELDVLPGERQTLFFMSHVEPGTSSAQSLSLWHCWSFVETMSEQE
jgi:hypothetical protein